MSKSSFINPKSCPRKKEISSTVSYFLISSAKVIVSVSVIAWPLTGVETEVEVDIVIYVLFDEKKCDTSCGEINEKGETVVYVKKMYVVQGQPLTYYAD